MIWHEYTMVGDSQLLVCRGEGSCGAYVKLDAWPQHQAFHLALDALVAAADNRLIGGPHA